MEGYMMHDLYSNASLTVFLPHWPIEEGEQNNRVVCVKHTKNSVYDFNHLLIQVAIKLHIHFVK